MLPLETLPFWPTVDSPTPLWMLWVILGLPIVLAILIAFIVKLGDFARSLRTAGRRGPGAFWVNPGRPPLPVATDVSDDDAPYTMGERDELLRAAHRGEEASGLNVSIFVGPSEAGRGFDEYAVDLFETLPDPERTILVGFEPSTRTMEFVLGDEAEALVDDERQLLAAQEASGPIREGNDVLGIIRAVAVLTNSDTERESAEASSPRRALAH